MLAGELYIADDPRIAEASQRTMTCSSGRTSSCSRRPHPLDPEPRRAKCESAEPIVIEDNVWLGGGAIVCPGVTVGRNTVVGAGSVVTKDLPADVLAVGSPAKVVRTLVAQ